MSSTASMSAVASAIPPTALTAHQKHGQAMAVASDLASLASEVGMREFTERLNSLLNLRDEWTGRTPATVTAPFDTPATVTAPFDRPATVTLATVTAPFHRPATVTPATVTAPFDRPATVTLATVTAPFHRPATVTPATVTAPFDRPATVTAPFDTPATVTAPFHRPATVTAPFDRPATVTAPFDRPATVTPATVTAPFDTPAIVIDLEALKTLKMPPIMRKRGRPKGAELTAIGVPKRRKRDGPQKFLMQLPIERERGICLFFIFLIG